MRFSDIRVAFSPQILFLENAEKSVETYLDLFLEASKRMNLTAIKDRDEMMVKHVYDCLLPASNALFDGKEICDVGTGAGFPGLLWAIIFPKAHVTLIEATRKKCAFLSSVIGALHLPNVSIVNLRAEETHIRERFDIVSARAVSSLPILLELCSPLANVGGLILAMKGAKGEEELCASKNAMATLKLELQSKQCESLPEDAGARTNLFFRKKQKTDAKYPRAWAKMQSNPL